MRPLRIAILTTGRFHVLDLARELAAIGHDITFHSCVPASRCARFGLPERCARPLTPVSFGILWLRFHARSRWTRRLTENLLCHFIDAVAWRRIPKVDVLIALSGISPRAGRHAREQGARLWIERGSRHIRSQMRILAAMPCPAEDRKAYERADISRELADYDQADVVVVPSLHVEKSFRDEGFPADKLFRNPYGVDVRMFPPQSKPASETIPTIVMTGRWSRRKGCDVLLNAWRGLDRVRLLHVGPVEALPLPRDHGFEHHEAVDQPHLAKFYAQGHVFVLASREEGLALVQAQALASGLRLVCTDRTGGEDLRRFLRDPGVVTVVPPDDSNALGAALRAQLDAALAEPPGLRIRLRDGVVELTWAAYALRYSNELDRRFAR